jgi:hypothetical protein
MPELLVMGLLPIWKEDIVFQLIDQWQHDHLMVPFGLVYSIIQLLDGQGLESTDSMMELFCPPKQPTLLSLIEPPCQRSVHWHGQGTMMLHSHKMKSHQRAKNY